MGGGREGAHARAERSGVCAEWMHLCDCLRPGVFLSLPQLLRSAMGRGPNVCISGYRARGGEGWGSRAEAGGGGDRGWDRG